MCKEYQIFISLVFSTVLSLYSIVNLSFISPNCFENESFSTVLNLEVLEALEGMQHCTLPARADRV